MLCERIVGGYIQALGKFQQQLNQDTRHTYVYHLFVRKCGIVLKLYIYRTVAQDRKINARKEPFGSMVMLAGPCGLCLAFVKGKKYYKL